MWFTASIIYKIHAFRNVGKVKKKVIKSVINKGPYRFKILKRKINEIAIVTYAEQSLSNEIVKSVLCYKIHNFSKIKSWILLTNCYLHDMYIYTQYEKKLVKDGQIKMQKKELKVSGNVYSRLQFTARKHKRFAFVNQFYLFTNRFEKLFSIRFYAKPKIRCL